MAITYMYYKCIWTPFISKQLELRYKHNNIQDARAVAILKGSMIVGHMP